jgi:hypothetical protein
MHIDELTAPQVEYARKLLIDAGLIEFFNRMRRDIRNHYEPWLKIKANESSLASTLYELSHLGELIPIGSPRISEEDINILRYAGLIDVRGNEIVRKVKLSCFSNWLCVADSPSDGNSSVYIGDDSLIFSEFISKGEYAESGLDMGFGSGISSVALAERCKDVTAFDVVPQCIEAGKLTAMLNGCENSIRFFNSDITRFTPPRRYDVIIGNPPGVPVPQGFQYSPAGFGGPDGLEFVGLFIQRAFDWCSVNGQVKMRFQSVGDEQEPFILPYVREWADSHNFDVEVTIDSTIPIEVRTALSVRNVLKLSPELIIRDVFRRFDDHMDSIGATTYSTILMTAKRSNGHKFESIGPPIDFSFNNTELSSLDSINSENVMIAFNEIIERLPNIFYLLEENGEIEIVRAAITSIRVCLLKGSCPRTVFDDVFKFNYYNSEFGRRALMLPFLAAVRAMSRGLNT